MPSEKYSCSASPLIFVKGSTAMDGFCGGGRAGITKSQSSRWQELARISDHAFEAKVTTASKRAYDGIAHRFIKEAEIEKAKQRHKNAIEHGCTVDDLIA